jgi:hypothetical protein
MNPLRAWKITFEDPPVNLSPARFRWLSGRANIGVRVKLSP